MHRVFQPKLVRGQQQPDRQAHPIVLTCPHCQLCLELSTPDPAQVIVQQVPACPPDRQADDSCQGCVSGALHSLASALI